MTFADAIQHLAMGLPIGRSWWKKSLNLCFNKDGLLTRADGRKIILYDEDFIADDWVALDGPEGDIGTKYDIR